MMNLNIDPRKIPAISFYLLALTLLISNFAQLPVLGFWEGFTFFHNFAPLDAHLTFRIGERANIGGQGYALLDISRKIADFFGWSIIVFKLPSIIIGWIGLCVFYVISKRICGFIPSLIAALFLGLNETFSLFQNEMIVSIVTFTLCLIVVERVQTLDANSKNKFAVITLGFFIALTGLHYGMGRFFALFLISFYLIKFAYLKYLTHSIKVTILELRQVIIILILSILFSFFILSPNNVFDFLSVKSFFFPKGSEVQEVSSGLLQALLINIKMYFSSLFYMETYKQAKDSSELLAGSIHTLISPIFLPFVLLGFVKSIRSWRYVNFGTHAPYGLINALFIITAIPPLFSAIVNDEVTTLSTYRMFNILIPAYLYGAIGINEILKKLATFKRQILSLMFIMLMFQGYILVSDRWKFSNSVLMLSLDEAISRKELSAKIPLFKEPNETKYYKLGREFIFDQIKYKKYADAIVNTKVTGQSVIFSIDLGEVSENSLFPSGLAYLRPRNYHASFISLYASDLGLNIAFVQAIGRESAYKVHGSGYMGKTRIFPAKLKIKNGRPVYKEPQNLEFKLRTTGPKKIEGYLATTQEELHWLVSYLAEYGQSPKIVHILNKE